MGTRQKVGTLLCRLRCSLKTSSGRKDGRGTKRGMTRETVLRWRKRYIYQRYVEWSRRHSRTTRRIATRIIKRCKIPNYAFKVRNKWTKGIIWYSRNYIKGCFSFVPFSQIIYLLNSFPSSSKSDRRRWRCNTLDWIMTLLQHNKRYFLVSLLIQVRVIQS